MAYMIQYDRNGEMYLAHHGVPGQKWGVRRYQNADGSLTKAGLRKYSVNSAHKATKSLNKIEKINAKLKTKGAITNVKAEKAFQKGKDKKYQKLKEKSKAYGDAVKSGETVTKKLLADAKTKGLTVNSMDKTRYTHVGRQITANLLAGPVGNVAVSGLDVYRAKTYGDEAGGIVKGKKYTAVRGH